MMKQFLQKFEIKRQVFQVMAFDLKEFLLVPLNKLYTDNLHQSEGKPYTLRMPASCFRSYESLSSHAYAKRY